MRCKNCKKKIENPNLFRCPHCGKPVVKKENNLRKNALGISFVAVTVLCVLLNFFSLFFTCEYYSLTGLAIAMLVFIVAFPFIYSSGWERTTSLCCAAGVHLPAVANWFAVFIGQRYILDRGGISTAYYAFSIAELIIGIVVLVLTASGIIKNRKLMAWICLALGAIALVFTVIFYAGVVKITAILIIAVNAFAPLYTAFYALKKEYDN